MHLHITQVRGKTSWLTSVVFALLCVVNATVFANDASYFEFDASFIQQGVASRDDKKPLNISRFFEANAINPGKYDVDLYLNDRRLGLANIEYVDVKNKSQLCFNQAIASKLTDFLVKEALETPAWQAIGTDCAMLSSVFDKANVAFDLSELKLTLNIPQANLKQVPKDYIAPSLWHKPENTGFVSYYTSAYYNGGSDDPFSLSANVLLGANVKNWSLRHTGSYAKSSGYNAISTFVRTELPKYNSQLSIGDFTTNGLLFDSLSLRGIQVSTDDRMLAPSLRGFSPLVKGIAKQNAKVTITQNGNQIYHRSIPAGAFALQDIPALGYKGDLRVTLDYADGSTDKFSVPNTGVTGMLRPKQYRYQAALGQIRRGTEAFDDMAMQATFQYGVNNLLTANTGIIYADGYSSWLLGGTFNTKLGAITADVALAQADFAANKNLANSNLADNNPANNNLANSNAAQADKKTQANSQTGFTASLNYSTQVTQTKTNINLAAYRYSSENYYRLEDWAVINRNNQQGTFSQVGRTKNQLQFSVNQQLDKWHKQAGSLFFVGMQRDFWDGSKPVRDYHLGYGNSYRKWQYDLFYRLTVDPSLGKNNQEFSLSLSIPLGDNKTPFKSLTSRLSQDIDEGKTQLFVSASGQKGKHNEYSYSTSASYSEDASTLSGQFQYTLPHVLLGSTASVSQESQVSLSASGGIVLHEGGVIFSNQLSDTFAIVKAKGASGAMIAGSGGNVINKQGYGVMPHLTPYVFNTISLETQNLPLNVTLESTMQEIVPRASAAVEAQFKANDGKAAMIEMTLPSGEAPPFGSQVTNDKGDSVAWVGQGGQIYLQDAAETDNLFVNWGSGAQESCKLSYSLNESGNDLGGIYMLKDKVCQF